jgi:uncharacterized membrane protein
MTGIVLVLHVIAALVTAAANVGALATTVLARRATSPRRILALLRIHNLFAAKTLVPGAVATLVTGAWLTLRTGVSLLAPWMAGTLVLFVASALIGIAYLLPEEARATEEARRLVTAGDGRVSETLQRHTAARGIVIAEWTAQLTMAAMFVLMIVQPG